MVYKHNIMGLNISKCEHHISLDCLSPCMRHSKCQQVGHTQIPAKPLVSDTVGSGSPHRNVCTGDDRQKGLKVIWCVCACACDREPERSIPLYSLSRCFIFFVTCVLQCGFSAELKHHVYTSYNKLCLFLPNLARVLTLSVEVQYKTSVPLCFGGFIALFKRTSSIL